MTNPYNVEGLIEQADDIISSGYGWSDWHEKELKELFADVEKPLREEFAEKYYNGPDAIPEGVTEEEVSFMSKLLGIKLTVKIEADPFE